MAEEQYTDFEERLIQDTIRFENGNFIWGSNSEIIPENEIDNVLDALSRKREMQSVVDSLSNLDIKRTKDYTDSLKSIIFDPNLNIENMNEQELINHLKNQDLILDIDTVYTTTVESDIRERLNFEESQLLQDNLRVVTPETGSDFNLQIDTPQEKQNLELLMDLALIGKGLPSTGSIGNLVSESLPETEHDWRRDLGSFTNFLGLGLIGQDIGSGVHSLIEGLSSLNPFN